MAGRGRERRVAGSRRQVRLIGRRARRRAGSALELRAEPAATLPLRERPNPKRSEWNARTLWNEGRTGPVKTSSSSSVNIQMSSNCCCVRAGGDLCSGSRCSANLRFANLDWFAAATGATNAKVSPTVRALLVRSGCAISAASAFGEPQVGGSRRAGQQSRPARVFECNTFGSFGPEATRDCMHRNPRASCRY